MDPERRTIIFANPTTIETVLASVLGLKIGLFILFLVFFQRKALASPVIYQKIVILGQRSKSLRSIGSAMFDATFKFVTHIDFCNF